MPDLGDPLDAINIDVKHYNNREMINYMHKYRNNR